MHSFKGIREPRYFQSFHCIAGDCQDSCCTGWDITIDQATFEGYQRCQDAELKPLLREHIVVNTKNVGDSAYVPHALVRSNQHICPFLTDERLCIIQKKLNEEALSITCATYPRTFNDVDGVLERSLNVSCQEAARLVLLNREPMQFISRENATAIRSPRIPVLNTHEGDIKPYGHFLEIRAFVIALLQDRTYPLWQRLIILSTFCSKLEQVKPEWYGEDVPYLLAYFTEKIREGVFRKPMNDVEADLEMQLQEMTILLNHRLHGGVFVSKHFSKCIREFRQGLCFTEGASLGVPINQYREAYNTYYQPFMETHEYILENYLVNYAFKNLFPFGPQNNSYHEQRSIYSEFILLALHYSLIKTLLIGIAGYHREGFETKQVIKLIQVFSKTIEHNILYLNQVLQYIQTIGMGNTAGITVLMKN